jgi:hypothetical protein
MSWKIKMLRLITKRPYGMAKFRVGRTWYSKIVRFDQDACEWYGGKYMFARNAITIEKSAGNRKVYDARDWVDNEEGYPIIFFDVNSAVPMRVTDESKGQLPGAKAIQATIKKEIAAFEAEMLRKQKGKLMLALIIVLLVSMVNFGLTYYAITKIDAVSKSVESIPGAIDTIRAIVTSRPGV